MAKAFGTERFGVSKIRIVNEYTVDVFMKHYYTSSSGMEVIISDDMRMRITPDIDLDVDFAENEQFFWATDEVKAICKEQFDDETVAEWNAMSDDEKSRFN